MTNWLACLFPDKAQEEVFGADPDARVTGVAAPTGMGERVPGGRRVSGRWSYNSGAPHATWAAVGALLKDDNGAVTDQALVLIPASDLDAEDTWHTAGMKATASNTLTGRDVFVPEHRVLSVPAAAKPLSFTVHSRQADSVGVQLQTAEAALKLETARLHTYRAVDEVDQAASSGAPLDYAARAHVRARAGFAAQQVLEAVSTLLNVHGASSFADVGPLQRIWRDATSRRATPAWSPRSAWRSTASPSSASASG
ncbi:acyl-CoA dehydrogenase family protein [Streptomyces sp. HC307]|uniref:acyl-CoA dehydrogenase family protein n=1 Tax=Streptomyces flavusporus TaxID=3385496 RepID=UPI003916CF46